VYEALARLRDHRRPEGRDRLVLALKGRPPL